MRNVTFATTQMACTDNVEENIAKAESLIRAAKEKGADVVLIQELFSYLYFCQVIDHKYLLMAQEEEGHPMLEKISALAKELEMVIPVTFFEQSGQARFNAGVIFDADGTKLGKYRTMREPQKSYLIIYDTDARIRAVLGEVPLFDGAEGTARQLHRRLAERDLLTRSNDAGHVEFLTSSANEQDSCAIYERFLQRLVSRGA